MHTSYIYDESTTGRHIKTDNTARKQEVRRETALKADHELEEIQREASQERAALLEDAEAAAAVAATQVLTIDELRALETSTRRELEKARQESTRSF